MKVPAELKELVNAEENTNSVLIVDDDEDINNMLKSYFEKKLSGMLIYQAFDGFEAGKIVSEKRPKYIVLDVDLPGIDGHQLCKKIKQDSTLDNPVVISITGLSDSRVKVAVLKAGADAFFAKPLDFEAIVDFIIQHNNK
jgi:DNA-binding response OmpR family regulator